MTLNPDNLIFFYFTGAIILLAMRVTLHAAFSEDKRKHKKHR